MSEVKLIECPACGKNVSSAAISCPSCGHPLTIGENKEDKEKNTNSEVIVDTQIKKKKVLAVWEL